MINRLWTTVVWVVVADADADLLLWQERQSPTPLPPLLCFDSHCVTPPLLAPTFDPIDP
jgi:hypothetical protein